jgi:hypothetical protein
LDRRLDGPQSWSGCGSEEKNSQSLPGLEPPIIQPLAQCYTTQLSQLLNLLSEKESKFIHVTNFINFSIQHISP